MSRFAGSGTHPRLVSRPALVLLAATLVLGGCERSTRLAAPDGGIRKSTTCGATTRVQVSPAGANILQTHTEVFSATAYDANGCASSEFFAWTSTAPSIAAVTPAANFAHVQGVQPGYATIFATSSNGVIGYASVRVIAQVPSRVAVTPATWAMQPGQTVQYSANVFDQQGKQMAAPVTWSSDAASVATIGGSGLATGVSTGATTIRATSGSAQGTASLTIRYALFVNVRGPHHVEYAGDYTYEAEVEGGDGNYTYVWWVDYGDGQHIDLGGGPTKTIHIAQGWGEALVSLRVYSAGISMDGGRGTTNGIGCGGDYCPVEP